MHCHKQNDRKDHNRKSNIRDTQLGDDIENAIHQDSQKLSDVFYDRHGTFG